MKKSIPTWCNLCATSAAILFLPSLAIAEIVSIHITATIESISDSSNLVSGSIQAGDTVTGIYTFTTATPDSNPLASVAGYQHNAAPYGIALTINGFSFRTNPDNVDFLVELSNDHLGQDTYTLRSLKNQFDLDSENAVQRGIVWNLIDSSESALTSTSLTATPPNLPDWPSNQLQIFSDGDEGFFIIKCIVTQAVAVPSIQLELERSTNLVDWESVVITPEMIVDGKLRFPSPEPAAFFRMKMP